MYFAVTRGGFKRAHPGPRVQRGLFLYSGKLGNIIYEFFCIIARQ